MLNLFQHLDQILHMKGILNQVQDDGRHSYRHPVIHTSNPLTEQPTSGLYNPPPRVMLNLFQHLDRNPHMKEILNQVQDDGLLT